MIKDVPRHVWQIFSKMSMWLERDKRENIKAGNIAVVDVHDVRLSLSLRISKSF